MGKVFAEKKSKNAHIIPLIKSKKSVKIKWYGFIALLMQSFQTDKIKIAKPVGFYLSVCRKL